MCVTVKSGKWEVYTYILMHGALDFVNTIPYDLYCEVEGYRVTIIIIEFVIEPIIWIHSS